MACQNGDRVKHVITGYGGIVIATTTWLNGCVRHVVQAEELKDGKPIEPQTFDVEELKVIKAAAADVPAVKPPAPDRKVTGGPHPTPTRPATAARR